MKIHACGRKGFPLSRKFSADIFQSALSFFIRFLYNISRNSLCLCWNYGKGVLLMATVSATARNTGMMYQFAAKSLNGNTSNRSMQGLLGGLSSSNSAWSNITSAAGSGLSYASAVASNRTSLSSLLSEYDDVREIRFLRSVSSRRSVYRYRESGYRHLIPRISDFGITRKSSDQ